MCAGESWRWSWWVRVAVKLANFVGCGGVILVLMWGGCRLEARESWAGSPAVAACTGVKQQGVCGLLPKLTPSLMG